MTLNYSIKYEDSLIQVNVTGVTDYLSLDQLLRDIVAACDEHRCFDVLGISNTEYLSMEEAYDRAAIFQAAGVTSKHRIAWVQENPASREFLRLAEAVVRNRLLLETTPVFDNVAEAKRWLAEKPGTDSHEDVR